MEYDVQVARCTDEPRRLRGGKEPKMTHPIERWYTGKALTGEATYSESPAGRAEAGGAVTAIRLGSLQLAALQCHTDALEPDPIDPMPATLEDGVLTFEERDRAALAQFLHDASNGADAQAEEERRKPSHQRDGDVMAQDRRMAQALAALAARIARGAK
jgi:hypothetical protein